MSDDLPKLDRGEELFAAAEDWSKGPASTKITVEHPVPKPGEHFDTDLTALGEFKNGDALVMTTSWDESQPDVITTTFRKREGEPMSEPTTEAGRRHTFDLQNDGWAKDVADRETVAIEAEARATAKAQLTELRAAIWRVYSAPHEDREAALSDLYTLLAQTETATPALDEIAATIIEGTIGLAPASSRFLDLDAPGTVELAREWIRLLLHSWGRTGSENDLTTSLLRALRCEPTITDAAP